MSYHVEEIRYLSSDKEHKIYAKMFIPDNEIKCIVQICHGMNGYIGKYDDIAKVLVEHGFLVCGNTHLGHIDTVNKEEEFGFFGEFNGDRYLVNDVRKLTLIIKKRFPEKNIFLFGHSMGSFIARTYITRFGDDLAGIIISATAGPQRIEDYGIAFLDAVINKKGFHFRSEKIYRILFRAANRKIENPTNDYAWVSKRSEEFVSGLTKKLYTVTGLRDIVTLIKKCNTQVNVNKVPKCLPMYFFSGTEDPLGEYGEGVKRAVKLYEKAGIRDITFRLYEGNRHECFNEDNKNQVINDMIDWIEKRNKKEKK